MDDCGLTAGGQLARSQSIHLVVDVGASEVWDFIAMTCTAAPADLSEADQGLLELALRLKPFVENLNVARRNADKLASRRTEFPSP